jgi:hypothetical protein
LHSRTLADTHAVYVADNSAASTHNGYANF